MRHLVIGSALAIAVSSPGTAQPLPAESSVRAALEARIRELAGRLEGVGREHPPRSLE